jgi:hypothetical protein
MVGLIHEHKRRFVMKPNRNNSLLRTVVLSALVFLLLAGVASAQTVRGKFALPAEVRWGLATLQPGEYTFIAQGVEGNNMVQVIRGGRVVALVMPFAHNPLADGPSALVIESSARGKTVSEIRLPDAGVALYYAPQRPKHGTAAEERETAQLIPITITATR